MCGYGWYPFFLLFGEAIAPGIVRRCLTIATQNHLLNDEIREPEVRLISDSGEQLGVMSSREALQIAEENEMDLVLISPQAKPPVCKIMDYGKYRFEQTKKERKPARISASSRSKRSACLPVSVTTISTPS